VDRLSTAEATAMEIAEANRLMVADLAATASTITNQDRQISVVVDVTDESCHRSILISSSRLHSSSTLRITHKPCITFCVELKEKWPSPWPQFLFAVHKT